GPVHRYSDATQRVITHLDSCCHGLSGSADGDHQASRKPDLDTCSTDASDPNSNAHHDYGAYLHTDAAADCTVQSRDYNHLKHQRGDRNGNGAGIVYPVGDGVQPSHQHTCG